MDADRWKQVDSLLQAALALPLQEREAFLLQACAGDENLEREVRSLLDSAQQAGDFLDKPAIEVEAHWMAGTITTPQSLPVGALVSHYRITGILGSGGMGVVYKARDTTLGRNIALKVLPDGFADDADRKARFAREARVLASLNHPNIAAIYGLEESKGVEALVMELGRPNPGGTDRWAGDAAGGPTPHREADT